MLRGVRRVWKIQCATYLINVRKFSQSHLSNNTNDSAKKWPGLGTAAQETSKSVESPQTTVNNSQQQSTAVNNSQRQQPTTANDSQRQPTTANNSQQQPTTANNSQQQPTQNEVLFGKGSVIKTSCYASLLELSANVVAQSSTPDVDILSLDDFNAHCLVCAVNGAHNRLSELLDQRTGDPEKSTCINILCGYLANDCNDNAHSSMVVKWYNTMYGLGHRFFDQSSPYKEHSEESEFLCKVLVDVIRTMLGSGYRRKEIKQIFVEEIRPNELKLDLKILNGMMSVLTTKKNTLKHVVDMFSFLIKIKSNSKDKVDVATFEVLMGAYAEYDMVEKLKNTFHSMVKLGIRPRTETYNVLIKASAKAGDINAVNQLVRELQQDDLQPNTDTFRYRLECYWKKRDFDSAITLFASLLDSELPLTYNICRYMMNIHYIRKDVSGMLEILEVMKQEPDCQPTCELYAHLLAGCAREGREGTFAVFYKEMKSLEHVSANSYSMIVKELIISHGDELLFVMEDLRSVLPHEPHVSVKRQAYSDLLRGYCLINDIEKAQAVVAEMKDAGLALSASVLKNTVNQLGLPEDRRTRHAAFDAVSAEAQRKFLDEVFAFLSRLGVPPVQKQVSALMEVVAFQRDTKLAWHWLQELRKMDEPLDLYCLNAILECFSNSVCADDPVVQRNYQTMIDIFDYTKDKQTASLQLEPSGAKPFVNKAFPNIYTWRTLIRAAHHMADHKRLLEWINIMSLPNTSQTMQSPLENLSICREFMMAFLEPPDWSEVAPHGCMQLANAILKKRPMSVREWNLVLLCYRRSNIPYETKWKNVDLCVRKLDFDADNVSYMHLFQMVEPGDLRKVGQIFMRLARHRSTSPVQPLIDCWMCCTILASANGLRNPKILAVIRMEDEKVRFDVDSNEPIVLMLRDAIVKLGRSAELVDYFSALADKVAVEVEKPDFRMEDDSLSFDSVFPELVKRQNFIDMCKLIEKRTQAEEAAKQVLTEGQVQDGSSKFDPENKYSSFFEKA